MSSAGDRPPPGPVLVAEDHPATAAFLAAQLEADGYSVRVARTADHVRALAGQAHPRAVLLGDLEPAPAALIVLADLRAGRLGGACAATPAVLVSVRGGELDALRALEAGADDFLAKPFSYPILRARLRAVLSRCERRPTADVMRVGPLTIDRACHSVACDGRPVAMRRREFDLLAHLAADPTRVFTKSELLRDVWGFRSAGATRTLDSHACRLRRRLAAAGRPMVINVWGVGYCLMRPAPRPA